MRQFFRIPEKINASSMTAPLTGRVIFLLAILLASCVPPSTGQRAEPDQARVTATAAAALATIQEALVKQPVAAGSAADPAATVTLLSVEATTPAAVVASMTALAPTASLTPSLTPSLTAMATPDLIATMAHQAAQTAIAATFTALAPSPVEPSPTPDGAAALTTEANRLALAVAATLTAQPTATPQPANPFAFCQVGDLFQPVWLPLQTRLGCNVSGVERGSTITTEAFQNGFLVWFAATDQIYALRYNASWSAHANTWQPGEASFSCPDAESMGYPAMGFGKLWCNEVEIRNSLGAPLGKETPDGNAHRQYFEHGEIFYANGRIFVLFSDQTWSSN